MADDHQVPISPVPDPPIRTLKVELLSNNSQNYVPCIPNAREPTPFETEFFKGVAMIVIRTKPIDPRFKEFFEGRRYIQFTKRFASNCSHAIHVAFCYGYSFLNLIPSITVLSN